ncbi:MAG: DUF4832 domain-containing protein [Acidobacteria bacterium]|nr:MAG: DUF4832 domain-containing protein [Acidobacteriota bacterium]
MRHARILAPKQVRPRLHFRASSPLAWEHDQHQIDGHSLEWRPKFDEFQKKIGYRFILRRFEYPAAVRAGHMASINMWWFNAGIAPIYRDFVLALKFGPEVVKTSANPRQWLPGDAVVDETVYVSETLNAGKYPVRVAILDPRTGQPAVKLAIEGREADGWYKVGEIEVK